MCLAAMAVQAPTTDKRRIRGDRTRQAILSRAGQLASADGLEEVSLQRLAGELGISKSGLFAHFGSKEEPQLATDQERKVFAGGCFFEAASVEFDSRPGPVREAVIEKVRYWSGSLARATREAQAAGEGNPDIGPEQLA